MPRREVVVSVFAGWRRAALLVGGELAKLSVDDGAAAIRRGDIVLGRAGAISRDLGAAFVDVGERHAAILMLGAAGTSRHAPREGESLVLQALRPAIDGKGAKLTAAIALSGRFLKFAPAQPHARPRPAPQGLPAAIAGLEPGIGEWTLRPAASAAGSEPVAAEACQLLAAWRQVQEDAKTARAPAILWRAADPVLALCAEAACGSETRIVCDDPQTAARLRLQAPDLAGRIDGVRPAGSAFARFGIDEQIERALAPEVVLPGGGRVLIAETPGLVSIDVDSGASREGSGERTALRVNVSAAAAIGRQVQLRDLSGHIVIDFMPLRRSAHRAQVASALTGAFVDDDRQVRIGGFTRLGLFELRRERFGPSLSRQLQSACAACGGSGRTASLPETARAALTAVREQTTGRACRGVRLIAGEPLLSFLRLDARAAVAETQAGLGRSIELVAEPSLPAGAYRIEIVTPESEAAR